MDEDRAVDIQQAKRALKRCFTQRVIERSFLFCRTRLSPDSVGDFRDFTTRSEVLPQNTLEIFLRKRRLISSYGYDFAPTRKKIFMRLTLRIKLIEVKNRNYLFFWKSATNLAARPDVVNPSVRSTAERVSFLPPTSLPLRSKAFSLAPSPRRITRQDLQWSYHQFIHQLNVIAKETQINKETKLPDEF